jgi:phosphohistidine swiveling domain-containing protein
MNKPYVSIGVRNRTLLTATGLLESYRHKMPGTDYMIKKALDTADGYADALCYEIADRKRCQEEMEVELQTDKYTQDFFDTIDRIDKETVQDIKRFWKDDLSKRSGVELADFFDRFFRIYIVTLHPMMMAIYASDLQELFERELRAVIGKMTQEQMLEYTALLLTPTRLTTVQKEEQILFSLQRRFRDLYPDESEADYVAFSHDPKTLETFEKLEREYGWFHMEYIGEPKRVADYQKLLWARVADLKKADVEWKDMTSPQERLTDLVRRQKEFFATHPDSALLQQIVFAMQEFLIVLDYTKADLIEGIYYARPLLTEIGKRVGIDSWIDVRYLFPDEMKKFLREKTTVTPEYIAPRKPFFACLFENDRIAVSFGDEARALVERIMQRDSGEGVREFKGMTAYPGKVRGIATVITGAQDRDKFQRGRIMVTRDTTTELTSVIKMASAIVADNGSLLSHTAIVSREFKIPCLVLTQIATKAVKDGDEIEVDASNGVVRILNHASKS